MQGLEIIVHLAEQSEGRRRQGTKAPGTSRVAGRVRHLVYNLGGRGRRIPVASSIDRAMFGYFASKRAAERVVADSGLP